VVLPDRAEQYRLSEAPETYLPPMNVVQRHTMSLSSVATRINQNKFQDVHLIHCLNTCVSNNAHMQGHHFLRYIKLMYLLHTTVIIKTQGSQNNCNDARGHIFPWKSPLTLRLPFQARGNPKPNPRLGTRRHRQNRYLEMPMRPQEHDLLPSPAISAPSGRHVLPCMYWAMEAGLRFRHALRTTQPQYQNLHAPPDREWT
jgi:hypothetical protein